jgi:phosphoribosylanthranilate isomerase
MQKGDDSITKIKICGLSRQTDIKTVNTFLPDYIGFVFAKSRRQVTEETADKLKERLNPAIKAVGVFVNEDIRQICRLCNSHIIDMIQLHGDENENFIKKLKNKTACPVIKAIRVRSAEDIERACNYFCDYLLFDTYQDHTYGGSGKTFDWTLIKEINRPYFLAGGLAEDNVLMSIKACNPYCIDVSSKVETNYVKDAKKIKDIITKIRSVN